MTAGTGHPASSGRLCRGRPFGRVPEELHLGGDQRHGEENVDDDRQCHYGQGHVDGTNHLVPGGQDDEQNDGDGAFAVHCSRRPVQGSGRHQGRAEAVCTRG